MSGKFLVTGATGKVGSEVIKQLAAKGETVRAGAHHPQNASQHTPTGVEVIHLDFADAASVKKALEGVDRVFLMTPPPYNLDEAQQVIDLAKQSGVQHIVVLSAAGVENMDTPLREIEKKAEASGIAYTHLRPSWFNQNFSTGMVESIKAGEIAIPVGDGKAGFIDARDIAAVAVAAFTEPAKHANQAYTLTGSEALDHYQVAATLSQAIGKEVKYNALSDEEFRQASESAGWPSSLIEQMSWLYGMIRQGYANRVTSDVSNVVGRDPITFQQFAHDYADIWK